MRQLLLEVKSGTLTLEEALQTLRELPYQDLGFAKLDHHRSLRRGFPEVILGEGKTHEQLATIAKEMANRTARLLITRASPEGYAQVKKAVPQASYHPLARIIVVNSAKKQRGNPGVAVLTGGTADGPVAEEAALTAEVLGNQVDRIYDVGISGLHRLLDQLPRLRQARVLVVVAGMDGALPTLVSGLVGAPVIGVPTSVGYGTNFSGLSALLTMLNSCSAGVAVVNIDNGFGAGYLAALINQPPPQPGGRSPSTRELRMRGSASPARSA